MKHNKLDFHIRLANYFSKQTLFYDIDLQKNPNVRKLIELPWQQTNSKLWVDLEVTLNNFDFIEAKARSGMIWNLLNDYLYAERALPGNEQPEYQAHIEDFTNKLMEFSLAHSTRREGKTINIPVLPDPPASRTRVLEPQPADMHSNWSLFERIYAWRLVITTHGDTLAKGEESAFQAAYNSSDYSPVINVAEQVMASYSNKGYNWIKRLNRRPFILNPACINVFENYCPQAVSLTPDGKYAFCVHTDGTLRMLNLENSVSQIVAQEVGPIWKIKISYDRRIALTCNRSDKKLRLWNLDTGECRELPAHTEKILSIALTPDGSRAISGSDHYAISDKDDATILLWDLKTGENRALTGDTQDVKAISMTPDGNLAVIGIGGNVHVWDLENNKNFTLDIGYGQIRDLAITPDGNFCVISRGFANNEMNVWDFSENQGCTFDKLGDISSIAVTADGKYAIYCAGSIALYRGEELQICDLKTGQNRSLKGHLDKIIAVDVTPDGRLAVSVGMDKTLRVWDLERGENPILDDNTCIAVSKDGRLAVSGGSGGIIQVWNFATGGRKVLKTNSGIKHSQIYQIRLNPDGKHALTWSFSSVDCSICMWDLESGENKFIHRSGIQAYNAKATEDGKRAVSSTNSYLSVWHLETGQYRTFASSCEISLIALSPDGRKAVSSGYDKICRVWDLKTGSNYCLDKDRKPDKFVLSSPNGSIAATPDNKYAIACDSKDEPCMWNLKTGESFSFKSKYMWHIYKFIILPDGKRAIFFSHPENNPHTFRILDLMTFECRSFEIESTAYNDKQIAITPDGNYILIGFGKKLQIIDIDTGKVVLSWISTIGVIKEVVLHFPNVAVCTNTEVALLKLENFKLKCPPYITGIRLWLWGKNMSDGSWDKYISAECPYCNKRFRIKSRILEAIDKIIFKAGLTHIDSPCLKLPSEAWNDPQLFSECPRCSNALRFNPFIVDEKRPWWKYWSNN